MKARFLTRSAECYVQVLTSAADRLGRVGAPKLKSAARLGYREVLPDGATADSPPVLPGPRPREHQQEDEGHEEERPELHSEETLDRRGLLVG